MLQILHIMQSRVLLYYCVAQLKSALIQLTVRYYCVYVYTGY